MSLHQLGIAHFPVLHRQFSSSIGKGPSESSQNQDITQDNKDVLIERLNDLVARLSKNSPLEDSTVTAIHSGVDQIELLMRGREPPPKAAQSISDGFDAEQSKENGEDIFWGPSMSPTRNIRLQLPDKASDSAHSPHHGPQMTSSRAIEIAKVAEHLSLKLAATMSELRVRKEESDHVHDLLITRAEKAAERILLLEYRIAEMEDGFEANQSELRFLRIQLQAIEAQCAQYIPRDEDEELTQSIMNWKLDWEDIDRRSKARRKRLHAATASLDDPHKAVDSSR